VTITGEGVHFNLRGYTITRDDDTGVFLRAGIDVRGANAHVNNGSIVDFDCPIDPDCSAIRLFEAPGAWIGRMSLHNNTVGITSLNQANADGARIHGNDITGNLRWGIGLFGSAEGAKITGNDLSDTGGFSFGGQGYIGSSDGVNLIGNVANNCAGAGILLWGEEDSPPAQRNTVRDNTTLDNGRAGIGSVGAAEAFRPRDNLIQGNTSFGNCLEPVCSWDLNEGVVGEGPQADCLNTWKDNDFDFAEVDCIE
jgi:parallel beta-helix repeat protein